MKLPISPPSFETLFKKADGDKLFRLFSANCGPTDKEGRYLHWDKLLHLQPPENLTSEDYWLALKIGRKKLYKKLPFTSKSGSQFQFCMTDNILKDLYWIDQNVAGRFVMDKPVTHPHTRDTYLVSSLIEEAISSSQLEGATTTRNIAKEMLKQGRKPKDHSEQMIFNNYQAMKLIREFEQEKLTPAMILLLHRILTDETLTNSNKAGQYRESSDNIQVVDSSASILLHTPPEASELPGRIERLCEFANACSGQSRIDTGAYAFIHPIVKAIILHFMIGYDHPFVDGTGRTARALFYWSMAQQQYWLMEFISISLIIKQAPAQYVKAYLYTETDDNDLTYFIIHQLEVIKNAIIALHEHIEKKAAGLHAIEKRLEGSVLQGQLNHRQLSILRHALDHPNAIYSIQEHQVGHKISYQTARTDLLKLADQFKILSKRKYGNLFVFVAPPDLDQKLAELVPLKT